MATNAYTIADLHLGHANAAKFRDCANGIEHDAKVIDGINAVVNPKDHLYLLGDIVITNEGLIAFEKINCRNIVLVPGNHCGERVPIRHAMYKGIMGVYARKLPGTNLMAAFTHVPVHPQCLDRWAVNIHGHLHDGKIDDPRYLCVSCEHLNFRPISMVEIGRHFLELGVHHGQVKSD